MRFDDQKILEDCLKRQSVERPGKVVSLKPDLKRMKTDKLYRPPPTSSLNHVFSSRLINVGAEKEPLTQARMQKQFDLLDLTIERKQPEINKDPMYKSVREALGFISPVPDITAPSKEAEEGLPGLEEKEFVREPDEPVTEQLKKEEDIPEAEARIIGEEATVITPQQATALRRRGRPSAKEKAEERGMRDVAEGRQKTIFEFMRPTEELKPPPKQQDIDLLKTKIERSKKGTSLENIEKNRRATQQFLSKHRNELSGSDRAYFQDSLKALDKRADAVTRGESLR
jgi:hypothetical protein